MSPMLQQLVVLLVVAVAVAYTGRRVWRSVAAARRKKSAAGCGPDCGCGE
jgi:hypothetical protein